jgi:hypothetical protein
MSLVSFFLVDNSYSSGRTPVNNQQNEYIQKNKIIELNNTPSKIMKNTTNEICAAHCGETTDGNTSQSMTGNKIR